MMNACRWSSKAHQYGRRLGEVATYVSVAPLSRATLRESQSAASTEGRALAARTEAAFMDGAGCARVLK